MTRKSIALLAGWSIGLATLPLAAQPPAAATPASKPVAAAPAAAKTDDGFTQRGVHEHGKVTVNVALEGGTLTAELEAPAINVLGFERAPRDAAEKALVAGVDRWLGSGVAMLGVPAAAGCVRGAVAYSPPKLGGLRDADHDHDHDHDPAEASGGHADYAARVTYRCSNPAALAWADLWLLRRLKNVTDVEVNVVTPRKQAQVAVSAAAPRVALQ